MAATMLNPTPSTTFLSRGTESRLSRPDRCCDGGYDDDDDDFALLLLLLLLLPGDEGFKHPLPAFSGNGFGLKPITNLGGGAAGTGSLTGVGLSFSFGCSGSGEHSCVKDTDSINDSLEVRRRVRGLFPVIFVPLASSSLLLAPCRLPEQMSSRSVDDRSRAFADGCGRVRRLATMTNAKQEEFLPAPEPA